MTPKANELTTPPLTPDQHDHPYLSVAIVCKDNEATIGRVLDSIRGVAREVVAVDSGSTDATISILESAGANIIQSDWLGYVKTKQKALDACTGEWVLCLDSDESLQPELERSIREFINRAGPQSVGARVNRQIWYCGVPLEYAWQPEWRLRLVRKGHARWGGLDPHDKLLLNHESGLVTDLEGLLRHDSFDSFALHLEAQARYARIMAGSLHKAGKRSGLLKPWISGFAAFFKQLVLRRAWRDGRHGWLAAYSTAAAALMKHVDLLELQYRAESYHNRPSGGLES